ncbi:hypothetical protein GQ53DRAFT_661865 [Thozetella sp. PMI_491]|nr:hypothetical protein GQ53DRAFT_661865 [Thozetella sp. PMI_491]
MGRKTAPQPLALGDPIPSGGDLRAGETLPVTSPSDSKSPKSPRSPFRFGQKKTQAGGGAKQGLQQSDVPAPADQQQQQYWAYQQQQQQQYSPGGTQFPQISSNTQPPLQSPTHQPQHQPPVQQQQQQQQPPQQQKPQHSHGHGHGRQRQDEEKASKSGFFFNFSKAARSSDRVNVHQHTDSRGETMSRDTDLPVMTKQYTKHSDSSYPDHAVQKPVPTFPSKTDLSLSSSIDYDPSTGASKKGKPKPFTLLTRSRSIKDKDHQGADDSTDAPVRITEPERAHTAAQAPLRTAPIQAHDRSFRDMMSSAVRNHSADRSQPRDEKEPSRAHAGYPKENGGSTFFSSFKASSSKAATMLGKGLFGNNARGGASMEKEPAVDDEHYILKVINLPLIEQTRRTRISKRLEDSRDKTEFWMPAFPWRAIDYLNYKGSDVEGLYRVPGSGPQIKKWQRKFDEEGDVDLFQQDDLYDINIIGSMLKAWLRELPDELFPKEAQDRIARECVGAETVPPLLIEELSNLSPFNYYLLFAITCHLSLLLAHSDKNKMDFRNLCICFQPCMKIDAFCFKFLVCDWRECWKGCKNEAKYIEEEYSLFDSPPPPGMGSSGGKSANGNGHANGNGSNGNSNSSSRAGATTPSEDRHDDRHATPDSRHHRNGGTGESKGRLRKKAAADNNSVDTTSTISTTLTINSERETPPRGSGDLRPLSPIKPLSPLGF